ncbi:MAG TPA: amino acid permease [Thermoleophilaceae bacterium]
MADATAVPEQTDDERRLAELGYKQDLKRAWSGFSNFAISFTIISVLAGCFTLYYQGWKNGGPVAISWGWPIVCGLVLFVAWSMSELVSAYPTAGGIYWWSSELGGKAWGWFTGWFNLVGLIGVCASVIYGSAQFLFNLLQRYGLDLGFLNFGDTKHVLIETFALFVVIMAIHSLINIYSSPLVARFNDISVVWHVIGVAVIIAILIFVPDKHQSASFVFGDRINASGFHGGATSGGFFWFYVLPLGLLLTMYTQTGYDASAHISEETKDAAKGAARGLWQSVFYAGVGGWLVLLAITFAVHDPKAVTAGGGTVFAVFDGALNTAWSKAVILIATVGQLFCGLACLTSASRMCYAFSRDRAVPGHRLWTRLNHHRVPALAVVFMAFWAVVVTLPALKGDATGAPYAFTAVTSITVIGLYIAYVIPVYLRWRKGDSWQAGPWSLGKKYKWINPIAVIWVAICVVMFSLPGSPTAVPGNKNFDWKTFNYAPVTVAVVLGAVGIWWLVSARHKFTGPVRNIEFDDAVGIKEETPA